MTTAIQRREMPTGNELVEKSKAFQSIGGLCSTGLLPKGLNTAQQVIAVCWIADAVGAHPMVALQECYVVHGKVGFSWRFKLGLVLSNLPEFEYEEIESTETKCIVRGRRDSKMKWVTVEYDINQARKQGLTSNPLYTSDPKDMLFKQAMHRLLDRVAGHVLRGMPVPEVAGDETAEPEATLGPVTPTPAPVEDLAPAPTTSEASVIEEDELHEDDSHATDLTGLTSRQQFAEFIRVLWPGLSRSKRLEKAGLVASQMSGKKVVYQKATHIREADARSMVEWLLAKYPEQLSKFRVQVGEQQTGGETEVADKEADVTMDGPPVMDENGPDGVEVMGEPQYVTFEEFLALVGKARKVLPKTAEGNVPKVVQEAPAGSGKMYITYRALLERVGLETKPTLFYEGNTMVMDPGTLTMLHENLKELVREAEKPNYAKG